MCMPPSWPTICFCQVSMFELKGRVALVTGGNGGIGLGMAKGLAAAGATLAIAGRDENACRAAVDQAAQKLGRLDILVNNAGTNIRKAPQDYTLEEWRLVLDTNLTSAFVASQAAYPHMKRAGGGKIINIGSMMSLFGASFVAPYGASKGGLVQLTKAPAPPRAKGNIPGNALP